MIELDNKYLDDLHSLIEEGKYKILSKKISALHPTDIAKVLNQLKRDDVHYTYRLLSDDLKSDVLVDLNEDVREDLLSTLTSKEIAEDVIEGLESDDAADVVQDLSEEKLEEVLSLVEDEEAKSDVMDLLTYEEGTAGALMAKELVRVEETLTVARAIGEIRAQADNMDQLYTVYVVDSKGRLTGRLSLKNLLLNAPSTRTPISELKNSDDLVSVKDTETEDIVVSLMEKYDIVALPVVDEKGILVGRITIDDAVDVIIEEAEKDYQLASGISEDVESNDSVLALTRARLPWLLIGLGGGIGGAYVIGAFDIESNPALALFIPLIAAMGGNVGVQSSAIVVQGLAASNLNTTNILGQLTKELSVGLFNGIICSAIIFLTTLLLGFGTSLSITVGISLLCVIVFAALFGTFVPLALEKRKIDPALATGPFITTANDIIGLIIYFSISSLVSSFF
ncbi:MAG: magnesium transporter [Bacteroidota bacterium]|nr:magnesium transporter [Bacteroidota bacterium]